MSSFPADRVNPARAFLYCGVDYCGPFEIKQFGRGRAPIKAYIALFVCFSTKAVHLELVCDLSTNSFLGALKRFISRRGKCATITSDNATNFVGARKQLRELKAQFTSQQHNQIVNSFCQNEGIQWNFIPPRSPHFGGLWETSVKKAKYHLTRTLNASQLTYDEFQTLMVQIEAIINSRPLTPISSDVHDFTALTPGHFLIGEPLVSISEPEVTSIPVNRLSRWQYISRLQQLFWQRWSREYLHLLQERSKWHVSNNISTGTLVLLRDEKLPPTKWALGRISQCHPGRDGKIRVVDVRTRGGTFCRSVHQLCPLPFEENCE